LVKRAASEIARSGNVTPMKSGFWMNIIIVEIMRSAKTMVIKENIATHVNFLILDAHTIWLSRPVRDFGRR
jgi:hypothetical protein